MLFPGGVAAATVTVAALAMSWCWAVAPLLRRRRVMRLAATARDSVVPMRAGRRAR
jgi:hypothetical protein